MYIGIKNQQVHLGLRSNYDLPRSIREGAEKCAHQVRCLLSLEQGSPAMNLTMKTVATLDNLARELSAIAEALYSAGYVVEYSLLNSAATLTASVSRNVEGKIETYARAALSEQKDRRP